MTKCILTAAVLAVAMGQFWAFGVLCVLACLSAADRGLGDPVDDLMFWMQVKLIRMQLHLRRAERRAMARR